VFARRVPGVHKVGDDSDCLIGPWPDVCSHVKLEVLSVRQERSEIMIGLYLDLGENRDILGPVFFCNGLGAEETPFLCRVPDQNVRSFLAPTSRPYQWNSISFTGSNPTESRTLYASRIVTVPDP
jgi:hypothetical protein